jgi:hypothetical protein
MPKNMNYNLRDALSRLKMASASTPMYTSTKEVSQAASKDSGSFQRSFSKLSTTLSLFLKQHLV